jgi:hypothetical protein
MKTAIHRTLQRKSHLLTEADLEGGVRGICYTTLIKKFNKQPFHEWLTRDL